MSGAAPLTVLAVKSASGDLPVKTTVSLLLLLPLVLPVLVGVRVFVTLVMAGDGADEAPGSPPPGFGGTVPGSDEGFERS